MVKKEEDADGVLLSDRRKGFFAGLKRFPNFLKSSEISLIERERQP